MCSAGWYDGFTNCYTWNDTTTCGWGADGQEVYETSCTNAHHTDNSPGLTIDNSWYGCSPTPQTTPGNTMGCGADITVCLLFGECFEGWVRFKIDTYGDVTGPVGACPMNSSEGTYGCIMTKG